MRILIKKLSNPEKFFNFKTSLVKSLIENSANLYYHNHEEFYNGKRPNFFEESSCESKILDLLKKFSRINLFRSPEAENKELAGHKIISGILAAYKPLLSMKYNDFKILNDAKIKSEVIGKKGLDYEWRLFNKLPAKYLSAYEKNVDQNISMEGKHALELFLRAHLIVDYIAGMTDNKALEIYHLLQGVDF